VIKTKINNKKAIADILRNILIAVALLLVMLIIYLGFSGVLKDSIPFFSFFG